MILIEEDESNEMLRISVDGAIVYESNFWDLPQSAFQLNAFFKKLRLDVQLDDYESDD